MATYNAQGVDVDGITAMVKAIGEYQSAIDKALDRISKTHANYTILNNAMKGTGITDAYKKKENALKTTINTIVKRLNNAQSFLQQQLKTAYVDGSKDVAISAFSSSSIK